MKECARKAGLKKMVLALLPVTAFASNPLDYSAAASTVTVDKTSVTAGDEVEFTVRFRAANGAAWTTEASFFFKSSRDAEEVTTTGAVTVKTVETTPRSITVLTGAELNAGVSVVTTGLTTADGVLKTPKDAATEKVFITRDDIQVTITIGSYVIEVVRDGVAETVTSDVAAFIKDGRTFLPLRVSGITVETQYALNNFRCEDFGQLFQPFHNFVQVPGLVQKEYRSQQVGKLK